MLPEITPRVRVIQALALVGLALISGAVWAPTWIKAEAFNVIRIAMVLGAAAFLALMVWGAWDMFRQERRAMRRIGDELSERNASHAKDVTRQNARPKP